MPVLTSHPALQPPQGRGLKAYRVLQLGSKGFGDPVTFDNAYYPALQQKPWAGAPADSMAAMIGLPSDKVSAQGRDGALLQL